MAREMYRDIVVVGGGVAGGGASVAIARYLSERGLRASVSLVSSDPYVYTRMALSYALKRGSEEIEPHIVYRPEDLRALGIEFINDTVSEIDLDKRTLYTRRGLVIEYDRLVVATGSRPVVPEIEGSGLRGVFTFQSIEDLVAINRYVSPGMRALVVGTGMIGLLAGDALLSRGARVFFIDIAPYPLSTVLEEPMARRVLNRIYLRGSVFMGGVSVERIEGVGRVERAVLTGGEKIPVDMVLFSIGVSPSLPRGLEKLSRGPAGSILTNEYFETSYREVYAVGDCASTIDYVSGRHVYRPLGIIASYSAGALPAAMYRERGYRGYIAYQVEEAMGAVFTRLGVNGVEARRLGINYSLAWALYTTPGLGLQRSLLLYERGSGRVVGWQNLGLYMVSHRSRVFEEAVREGLRIGELEEKGIKTEDLVT